MYDGYQDVSADVPADGYSSLGRACARRGPARSTYVGSSSRSSCACTQACRTPAACRFRLVACRCGPRCSCVCRSGAAGGLGPCRAASFLPPVPLLRPSLRSGTHGPACYPSSRCDLLVLRSACARRGLNRLALQLLGGGFGQPVKIDPRVISGHHQSPIPKRRLSHFVRADGAHFVSERTCCRNCHSGVTVLSKSVTPNDSSSYTAFIRLSRTEDFHREDACA